MEEVESHHSCCGEEGGDEATSYKDHLSHFR